MPATNFGDDIRIRETSDGYLIEYLPTEQTLLVGRNGTEADALDATAFSAGAHGGVELVTAADGADICDAINQVLGEAGAGGAVVVEPGRYTKDGGAPINTAISGQAPDQTVIAYGATVEPKDGADAMPVDNTADGFAVIGGTWLGNIGPESGDHNNTNVYPRPVGSRASDGVAFRDLTAGDAAQAINHITSTNATVVGCAVEPVNYFVQNCINFIRTSGGLAAGNRVGPFTDTGVFLDRSEHIDSTAYIKSAADHGAFGYDIAGAKHCTARGTVRGRGQLDHASYVHRKAKVDPLVPCENIVVDMTVHALSSTGHDIRDSDDVRLRGTLIGEDSSGTVTMTRPWQYASPDGLVTAPTIDADLTVRGGTHTALATAPGADAAFLDSSSYEAVNSGGVTISYSGSNSEVDVSLRNSGNVIVGTGGACTVDATTRPTTDTNGQVTLDWSVDYRFVDKPALDVALEQAGSWHVTSWTTDSNGRYSGATIQITDGSGAAVADGVGVIATLVGT